MVVVVGSDDDHDDDDDSWELLELFLGFTRSCFTGFWACRIKKVEESLSSHFSLFFFLVLSLKMYCTALTPWPIAYLP